ncbi:ferritin family protein [Planctomycetota bacterium]
MSITFNADEIFEMAEEIEKNGAKFYRKAAENVSDKDIEKLLLELAVTEDGHLQTFRQMRQQLSGPEKTQNTFDPDSEAALYLQAMAEARGYEGKKSPTVELTGKESVKEVFEIALNAEKESVVFYFGLKSLVSEKAGKDKVEKVITEELSHITTLLSQLKALN